MKRSARTRLVKGLDNLWENQLKILDQFRM